MARHNREGSGTDQWGQAWQISYQPDWLDLAKVTRVLPNGRQSTRILFRNPERTSAAEPGDSVRTRIRCPEARVDVEVVVTDPARGVRAVRVACAPPGSEDPDQTAEITLYPRPRPES